MRALSLAALLFASPACADPLTGGAPPVNTSVVGTAFDKKAPICYLAGPSAPVTNTTTETSFGPTCSIPANTISPGNALHIHVGGLYSAGSLQTATGKVKTTTGTPSPSVDSTLLNTGAVGGLANATNQEWSGDIYISFYTATTYDVQGSLTFQTGANATLTVPLSNTGAFTYDPTQPFVLYLSVTWGAASASNSMTLRTMVVK